MQAPHWDITNSINWQDTNGNLSTFNYGDPVTFNDTGREGAVLLMAFILAPLPLR